MATSTPKRFELSASHMLKINLLPEGARKAGLSNIEQFHRTPLMFLLLGLLMLVAVAFSVPIPLYHRQLQQLNAKIQVLDPKKREVDRLQRTLKELRTQQAAFQGLEKGHGLWAKRLNVLSDVVPDGIWFTEFSLDEKKGLVIQGSALGQSGSEMVNVGRLVQDLKADPDFGSVVKDIQIESIKRVQEKEVELVQFTLSCTLQETPAT